MVQTSNTSMLWETWNTLYNAGIIPWKPTECQKQCDMYAFERYTQVFYSLHEPPFRCDECHRQVGKKTQVVDHIDGIHGGFGFHNCPENLRILCFNCNRKQG